MSVLKPEELRRLHAQLQREMADTLAAMRQVCDLYHTASGNAYAPPRHGTDVRAQSRPCGRCKGSGALMVERHRVLRCPDCGGDGSFALSDDRTGNTVIATERFRHYLGQLERHVRSMRTSSGHALAAVNDALALLEPPLRSEVADTRLLPHPTSELEVLRARAAQRRRKARALATGDESEVL